MFANGSVAQIRLRVLRLKSIPQKVPSGGRQLHVSGTFKALFRTEGELQADIGIVVSVTPRRNTMQATNRIRNILAVLSIVLAAAALIGATVWTPTKEARLPSPVTKAEAPTPMVGTFTGEFENGVPVYRLPSISVTVSRSAELARMAQEEQLARK
jgi:hypothetical protein